MAVTVGDEWLGRGLGGQVRVGGIPENWLILGGRGAGKTRLGAEWVNGHARALPPFTRRHYGRIALVGETLGDVREVMIEGPSGIAVTARGNPARYEPGRRRVLWESGAVAFAFSAEDPDSLRGAQFDAAWCDEIAKWRHARECFDMLQFGLRLGDAPRQIVTTTPRATAFMRELVRDPLFATTRLRTADNAGNLAPGFLAAVRKRYGGTRLGRQELDGELIEDRADALWRRETLEAMLSVERGALRRVVVAVDPPATGDRGSASCGIVVAGVTEDGIGVVLEDGTVEAAAPTVWASRAIGLYHRWEADRLVAEVNQGGDMVAAVIGSVDPGVPVAAVRATRGKWLRAEPVAALYEQGRVRHAARMPALEDEMCDFGPDGLSGGRSPDRVDALVWAMTELMLKRAGSPRVRIFGQ